MRQLQSIFAQRTKMTREQKKIPPCLIAKCLDISEETYHKIEEGVLPASLMQAAEISFVLDTDLEYLLGMSNEPNPTHINQLLNSFDLADNGQKVERDLTHKFMLLDEDLRNMLAQRLNQMLFDIQESK